MCVRSHDQNNCFKVQEMGDLAGVRGPLLLGLCFVGVVLWIGRRAPGQGERSLGLRSRALEPPLLWQRGGEAP